MKKILLILLIISIGVIAFGRLRAAVGRTEAEAVIRAEELCSGTNQLAETQKQAASLRGEMLAKQNHLRMIARHPGITPELLELLEKNFPKASPAAWAQLRQQLGIGWNSSPDYVLINKRILEDVTYDKFSDAAYVTDTACDFLGLSPQEKSALNAALKQERDAWQGMTFQRTEPSGDVVAQYTLTQPDAATEQSLSNNFTAGVTAAIGPERAELLGPWGWWEFKNQMGMGQTGTMTIRQTVVDGQPDLVCEMQMTDGKPYTSPVRYANYPSGWFLTLFPGGWDTLAQRENFPLPAAFHK